VIFVVERNIIRGSRQVVAITLFCSDNWHWKV